MIGSKQADGKIVAVAESLTPTHSPSFVAHSASGSFDDHLSHGAWPDRPSSVRAVVDLSALVPRSVDLFVHRASEVRSK